MSKHIYLNWYSDDASTYLAVTSFGIPLTGSMAAGFTVGFIKGG
jgi:hypothetical protein